MASVGHRKPPEIIRSNNLKYYEMENIELLVIGCLLIICAYYMLQNKRNKYWRTYFKEQYFREKDFVDKYIEKACNGKNDDLKNANSAIFDVSKVKLTGVRCAYCSKIIPEKEAVNYKIIFQNSRQDPFSITGWKKFVDRKTNKYCSTECGIHDQMAHDG